MKKTAQIANFNIVFGKEEKPMLEYFDSIIYPAFVSEIEKESNGDTLLFNDIEVEKFGNDYILVGKIVKKTVLEVLSDVNEKGQLYEKDEHISAAPFSTFIIYLRNHRMVYVPNQKGSPTLSTFRSVFNSIVNAYITKENQNRETDKLLPRPEVNIIGISGAKFLKEILSNVEKINNLTLRFYPLNGDIDFSGMFGMMTKELRETVGSKNGEIQLKSPKSVEGVIDVLDQAAGTINPIIKVTKNDKSTVTLKDYQITERFVLDIDEDELEVKTEQIVRKCSVLDRVQYTNSEHNRIYESNVGKIIPFVKK